VKRFVVIDDEDDELDELPLFQPSPATGLTATICTGIAKYLEGEIEHDMRRNALVRKIQNIRAALAGHQG
jgi:hypothetical protein